MLWTLGIAALFGAVWLVHVRVHPWRICPRCHGDGRLFAIDRDAFHVCGRCGGTKKVRRIGAGKEM